MRLRSTAFAFATLLVASPAVADDQRDALFLLLGQCRCERAGKAEHERKAKYDR